MSMAVHEKCGGAVDATADSACEIGSNAWLKFSSLQSVSQLSRVKVKLLSQFLQKPVSKAVLVLGNCGRRTTSGFQSASEDVLTTGYACPHDGHS
jgi:hypothetical protein